jgi:hypothetical protein
MNRICLVLFATNNRISGPFFGSHALRDPGSPLDRELLNPKQSFADPQPCVSDPNVNGVKSLKHI